MEGESVAYFESVPRRMRPVRRLGSGSRSVVFEAHSCCDGGDSDDGQILKRAAIKRIMLLDHGTLLEMLIHNAMGHRISVSTVSNSPSGGENSYENSSQLKPPRRSYQSVRTRIDIELTLGMGDLGVYLNSRKRGICSKAYEGFMLHCITDLFAQVATMHTAGLVHCDIKPGNVVPISVDERPYLMLADHGANALTDSFSKTTGRTFHDYENGGLSRHPRTTCTHRAPENFPSIDVMKTFKSFDPSVGITVMDDEPSVFQYTEKSDVYSLAVTVVDMLMITHERILNDVPWVSQMVRKHLDGMVVVNDLSSLSSMKPVFNSMMRDMRAWYSSILGGGGDGGGDVDGLLLHELAKRLNWFFDKAEQVEILVGGYLCAMTVESRARKLVYQYGSFLPEAVQEFLIQCLKVDPSLRPCACEFPHMTEGAEYAPFKRLKSPTPVQMSMDLPLDVKEMVTGCLAEDERLLHRWFSAVHGASRTDRGGFLRRDFDRAVMSMVHAFHEDRMSLLLSSPLSLEDFGKDFDLIDTSSTRRTIVYLLLSCFHAMRQSLPDIKVFNHGTQTTVAVISEITFHRFIYCVLSRAPRTMSAMWYCVS